MSAYGLEREVLLREDFNGLDDWKPLTFPKIEKHTTYSIFKDGDKSYLKADSNASASGIVFKKEFNVFEYSKIRWSWKIRNVLEKGNAKERSGDDYPLRVYIIFKYNPEIATFGKRVKYGIAKSLYGEYPPDSSLNYIWANRQHDRRILTNTYAEEAMMILLRSGPERSGIWTDEGIDIIKDYHKAFGQDPPPIASLAIMSDTDNTGESAVAYIDFIEIFR
jgi:hypothetical protein